METWRGQPGCQREERGFGGQPLSSTLAAVFTPGSWGLDGDYAEVSSPPGEILIFITGGTGSQRIGRGCGPHAGAETFGARH